jgi:hypothetical protein
MEDLRGDIDCHCTGNVKLIGLTTDELQEN